MTLLRRLAYAALAFAYVHIVFGAIVRITGSGMGCGDHWPKCYGRWFPPLDRMDLVIEVSHRYLAFGLSVTILALLASALLRRREPGVPGRGGVLRSSSLAFGLVLLAAVLGGVVVKLELTNPHVIVAHLGIAMALVGALTATVVRAGGLGARSLPDGGASARTWRGARVAAGLALVAVLLGGLTAHLPGANSACVGFPHCRETLGGGEALAVHVVHRVVAFLLLFHTLALALGVRKRGEAPLVRRLAWIAFGIVLVQILVAAVLVELRLPAVWRSLHQAVGTGVWMATLLLAVIARRGFRGALATSAESGELRRPVAAATAAAMLAVDAVTGTESHAAEPWAEQPPAAETKSIASSELEGLAVAGYMVVDEAAVESSVVAIADVEEVDEVEEDRELSERAEVALPDDAGDRGDANVDVIVAASGDAEPARDAEPVRGEMVVQETPIEATLGLGGGPPMVAGTGAHDSAPAGSDPVAADAEIAPTLILGGGPPADEETDRVALDSAPIDVAEVELAVVEPGALTPDRDETIAAEREALIARFADDADEAHELDRAEPSADETPDDDEALELDANAAALAELERLEAARIVEAAAVAPVTAAPVAAADAVLPAPAPRRPPTLAVIIARGADF